MELLQEIKDREIENHVELIIRKASRTILFDENDRMPILFVSKYQYHKLPRGGIHDGEDTIKVLLNQDEEIFIVGLRFIVFTMFKNIRRHELIEMIRYQTLLQAWHRYGGWQRMNTGQSFFNRWKSPRCSFRSCFKGGAAKISPCRRRCTLHEKLKSRVVEM